MIRFKEKVFEDYFIDPITAVITDKNGNVQETYLHQGRETFKKMAVHVIQMHTYHGYVDGMHIHHKDFNCLNNALSNLEYLTASEHHSIHTKILNAKLENKEKVRQLGLNNKGRHLTEEQKQKISLAFRNLRWWNNGVISVRSYEKPDGFVEGRIYRRKKYK